MLRSLAKTNTPANPVTLTEAKVAARVDTADLDAMVQDLLNAAIERAEHDTDRSLCTTTWLLKVPDWVSIGVDVDEPPQPSIPNWEFAAADWPVTFFLELPRPPLASVQSIQYYDQTNTLQTMAAELYRVDTAPRYGRIALVGETSVWPHTARRWDAVQIAFTAGYGDPEDVPAAIKVGVKKLVTHWFHNPAAMEVPAEIARIFELYAAQRRGYG